MPGRRFATPLIDGRRVEWLRIPTQQFREVVFDGDLVGDDVDQRIERSGHPGCSCGGEHCQQRIEAALRRRPFEQVRVHPVAPSIDAGIPVGAELGVAEPVEDLLDHRPRHNSTSGIEKDALADDADMRIAIRMRTFVRAVRSVSIRKRLPPLDDDPELVEPQVLGVTDQQRSGPGQLVGATRIGEHPTHQPSLCHTQPTVVSRSARLGDRVQQPCALHHRLGVGLGCVARRSHPPGHRHMTVLGVGGSSVCNPDDLGDHRLHPPASTIQLGQHTPQVARRQPLEVGKLRQIDRTHVRIIPQGCNTVTAASGKSLVATSSR